MPLFIRTGSLTNEQIRAAVDAGFVASRTAYIDLLGRLVPERVPKDTGQLQRCIIASGDRSTEETYVMSARDAVDRRGRSYIGYVDRIHQFWKPMKMALKSQVGKVFRDTLRAQGMEVFDSKRAAGLGALSGYVPGGF